MFNIQTDPWEVVYLRGCNKTCLSTMFRVFSPASDSMPLRHGKTGSVVIGQEEPLTHKGDL